MVVLLGYELNEPWVARLERHVGSEAMVLAVRGAEAEDLARRLPVAVLVAHLEPLTTERLLTCRHIRESLPGLVSVYVAPPDVREQVLNDNLALPDFWLTDETNHTETGVVLRAALQQARLVALTTSPAPLPTPSAGLTPEDTHSPENEGLLRVISALAGSSDEEQLLRSYVEAAADLVHCSSYCLLWQDNGQEALRVRAARGLHPEVAARGRLSARDALPLWYTQSTRALTRAELANWTDTATATALARELAVFRGEVVLPLGQQGVVRGLLVLGEKIVGESYSRLELERLFTLSGFVATHLENLRLQQQAREMKEHLEHSLASIQCGLLTLNAQGCIIFCNPYAALLLGQRRENLEGADLRALPSPLGDHLFAASRTPEAAVLGQEVTLAATGKRLRISTAALHGGGEERSGSVMLLEDLEASGQDQGQAVRRETLQCIGGVIGRLAHEVRTPLTAVRTYAQLLGQSGGDSALGEFWEQTVRPELERLERLIEDQVRLVQMPEPSLQLVSLETLAREAVAALCVSDDRRTPVPQVTVQGPLPQVVADPVNTREAVLHFLRFLQRRTSNPVAVQLATVQGAAGQELVLRLVAAGADFSLGPELLDPLHVLGQADGDLGPAIARQLLERQGARVETAAAAEGPEIRLAFPVLVAAPPFTSGAQAHG